MRVRFIGRMPAEGYSGGRLLALTMAESLAMTGAKVDFVVDRMPYMYEEFREFSRVELMVGRRFWNLHRWVDQTIDVVVVVPNMGNPFLHRRWARHSAACGAKTVLLNFESPNWFNSVSPYKRDTELWKGWDVVSRSADLILSISGEGDKYARQYYRDTRTTCRFDYCYPGINTVLADRVGKVGARKRQIVLLTRIDPHKGAMTLDPLADSKLEGFKVIVCVGNGTFPPEDEHRWQARFRSLGMQFEIRYAVRGVEKFKLLKESALLYFPSRFEGFGLPPLEAAYSRLPCACTDLRVLREFGKKVFSYGDPSDKNSMRAAVHAALGSKESLTGEYERISAIARMGEWGRRQERLFGNLIS